MTKLYTLVQVRSSGETIYMTDSLKKVTARKKALETSQRKMQTNYQIRPALETEPKYMRPPAFNFDPSGDAGSKKYVNRKARARRIKQKNPRRIDTSPYKEVDLPPVDFIASGELKDAMKSMEEMQGFDIETEIVQHEGTYYTVYREV